MRGVFFLCIVMLLGGCVAKFIPEATEEQNLLVVEGLITDQPEQNHVKISTSMPLGIKTQARPLSGCTVTVTDDQGSSIIFDEKDPGNYLPPSDFQGIVGRYYTLHILGGPTHYSYNYQSLPVLLRPVPPIDTIYYDKLVLTRREDGWPTGEGCQIYLDAHDPTNTCKYYRWEFVETWEFTLPYLVPNAHCWVTDYSDQINIKNTSSLSEDKFTRIPVNFITNESDRLLERYSILVNQYSLDEEEFSYWEKLQNVIENVGSLYDMIPSSIPSNISCIEDPEEKVFGYFSVSGMKSKRVYIDDQFRGIINLYSYCEHAIIAPSVIPPGLGMTVWIIIDHQFPPPAYKVLTYTKGCADCTTRGTTIKPDFWTERK